MNRIVLVGVGGSGMSALAQIFFQCGYKSMIGIDASASMITDFLSSQGINIVIGHAKVQIQASDFVIYSDATAQSPEVIQAHVLAQSDHKHYHRPLTYFEFLGEISKYMHTIAIAGSHGKSTTTSMMITTLYDQANFALGIVGAQMKQFDGHNFALAGDKVSIIRTILGHIVSPKQSLQDYNIIKHYIFVVEADEFHRHFLYLDIDHLLVTNIQRDHPDTYPSALDYIQVFDECMSQVRKTITMHDDALYPELKKKYADQIQLCPMISYDFSQIFGDHNQSNASLVEGFVKHYISEDLDVHTRLCQYSGILRRCEYLAQTRHRTKIYTDYAHHPTEVRATYQALSQHFAQHRIHIIYQPHQVGRILNLRDDMLQVCQEIEDLILYRIYAVREDVQTLLSDYRQDIPQGLQSADELGQVLAKQSRHLYVTDFRIIGEYIKQLGPKDIVCIMSAGDLDALMRSWIKSGSW